MRTSAAVWRPVLLVALAGCPRPPAHRCASAEDCPADYRCDEATRLCVARVRADAGPADVDAGRVDLDAGPGERDGGPLDADGGLVAVDAVLVDVDANTVDADAGAVDADAGTVDSDAGSVDLDAGVVAVDAGSVDAAACTAPGNRSLSYYPDIVRPVWRLLLTPSRLLVVNGVLEVWRRDPGPSLTHLWDYANTNTSDAVLVGSVVALSDLSSLILLADVNAETRPQADAYTPDSGTVIGVAAAPQDPVVYAGLCGADNSVWVFDTEQRQPIEAVAGSLGCVRDLATARAGGRDFLVVVGEWQGVVDLYHLDDPRHPVLLHSAIVGTNLYKVATRDALVLASGDSSSLQIMEISGTSLHLRASWIAGSAVDQVAFHGERAVAAIDGQGLAVLDLANPGSPLLVTGVPTLYPAHGLAIDGDLAMVGEAVSEDGGSSGLVELVDLTCVPP